eukprot:4618153-Amphidinium_carterae.1
MQFGRAKSPPKLTAAQKRDIKLKKIQLAKEDVGRSRGEVSHNLIQETTAWLAGNVSGDTLIARGNNGCRAHSIQA